MTILAKTTIGKEFLYSPRSARKVSKRSAATIRDVVNQFRFQLGENETWHIYEIDEYSPAYDRAVNQSFTIRNGIVSARNK